MITKRSSPPGRRARAVNAPALGLSMALGMLLAAPEAPALDESRTAQLGVAEEIALGSPAGPPLSGVALEEETDHLANEMRCPVCQGLSIGASPSPMARDMLAKVRDLVARGYSREQILTYFEGTYGEFVRLAPKPRGFNLVVWVAPFVVLLLGALVMLRYLRHVARDDVETEDPELAELEARVRREVSS